MSAFPGPGYSNNARGIDVSHWRVVKDWFALSKDHISFIGIKATEGNKTTDSALAQHREGARRVGFELVIYYHFARSGDPLAQARRFMNAIGALKPNERLALDLEASLPEQDQKRMLAWLDVFYKTLNETYSDRKHFIYTSKRIWEMFGNPSWDGADNVELWAPRYNSTGTQPAMPKPWEGRPAENGSWKIWQWSDGEFPENVVAGVGKCDSNIWAGTVGDLREWRDTSSPASPGEGDVTEFIDSLNDVQVGRLREILAAGKVSDLMKEISEA